MILKILIILAVFLFMAFSFIYVYENLPINPKAFVVGELQDNSSGIISYETMPMFAENMRFGHNEISYFIESFCSNSRILRIKNAFRIFSEEVGIVSFYEISDGDKADIFVGCSEEEINVGGNLFAIGEGGPTKFIKVGNFNIIEKGRIHLYKESKCDYPVVELHELFHVFGFDHSEDQNSIMFSVYNCDQRITPDIINTLKELYSIEPLPDARITELSAVKKGRYLDFNITIANEGLSHIENISFTILSKDKEIAQFPLEEIQRGYSRTLRVTNLKMFSSNIDTIDFYVDYENLVPEIYENNNHAQVMSQ